MQIGLPILYVYIQMNHLECVTAQRNQWYWYLLILFLSFLISNTLGTIPYMAVSVWNILRSGGCKTCRRCSPVAASRF